MLNDIFSDFVVIGIFGAGGFAREVMPVAIETISKNKLIFNVPHRLVFVEEYPVVDKLNGYDVISEKDFIALKCAKKYFNIAIGDSNIREKIYKIMFDCGVEPITLTSCSSNFYDSNEIDIGGVFCANTLITSNVIIGKFFQANIYSYVAHDCVIGDYVTFAPGVHCNGYVHIGDHAYIGTGVVIKQGSPLKPIVIGAGAIVGMGSVVTKDVPPNTTVVGNPARVLVK